MTFRTKNDERRTTNKKEKARFLFLNQFVFPDPAPTARLIGDVTAELRARGHELVLVGDGASYHGRKTLLGSRALRELSSLLRLLVHAVFSRRADVIVCLTSPPLLPVVAWLARFRHRDSKLIHWAMDLYPDVAVALGEVREGSLLHRMTSAMMGRVYRSCDLIVALDEDMAARIALHGTSCEVQPPWPPMPVFPPVTSYPGPSESSPFVWLYSGNLGRAHEWKTLLDAQHQLERDGIEASLVFQGGGTEREAATEYAKTLGLTRCRWLPYADDAGLIPSLIAADCLIATQRPETKGCLWPSKLALALLLERPILWIGPGEAGVSSILRSQGHWCFAPGEDQLVASAIKTLAGNRGPFPSTINHGVIENAIREARSEGVSALVSRFEGTKTVSAPLT